MANKSLVQFAANIRISRYNRGVKFSYQLEAWLKSDEPKTIAGLMKVAEEKSFAVLFLVLMAIPALPLPTGGVTHVFEAIAMLLALELIIGRTTIWLPAKWLKRPLGKTLENRTLPYLISKVRWLEKYSRPRLEGVLRDHNYLRLIGLVVFIFSLGAFLAPPFSGLDTVPSLGVVAIALAMILEDFVVFAAGLVIGTLGLILEIGLGATVVKLVQNLF